MPVPATDAAPTAVAEGDLLWTPSADRVAGARLTEFTRFAEARTGRSFPDYAALWTWSTTELEDFWQAVWDFFDVRSSAPHTAVLEGRVMPGARWFPGARLNLAEHVLRQERPGQPALLFADEPTSRLDQPNAIAVGALLASLARERGATIVCATHGPVLVEQADEEVALAQPAAGEAVAASTSSRNAIARE